MNKPFIVTKEDNGIANTESLMLLCEALNVNKSVVNQLSEINPDIFDSFEEDETVSIITDMTSDCVEMSITTDNSSKKYKVCVLNPKNESPYWKWVLEYIRNIIEGELIEREISYKIIEYPFEMDMDVPFK